MGSHVLVVDDDPAVRSMLALWLTLNDYTVVEAADGLEALQALQPPGSGVDQPGVVLLDMILPHMDGLQVLQSLRRDHARVPVIAMSTSQEHLELARAAGADHVAPKPFDMPTLLGLVAQCCSRGSDAATTVHSEADGCSPAERPHR